jgi:4-hydroxybenzoate polyprenyltransferase
MSVTVTSREATRAAAPAGAATVCVDLDGTLLAGDLFWESLLLLVKARPSTVLWLPLWLLRGKAHMKREVARRMPVDVERLPYRPEVLAFIHEAHADGRPVVLATAADSSHAADVAAHLGVFASVLASNGVENLSGRRKAQYLEQQFGTGQFEYVGNDWVDVPAWVAAGRATVVAAPSGLLRHLQSRVRSVRVLVPDRPLVRSIVRALRPYQWVKNLLVFVPLITSHRILDIGLLVTTALTLVAFSLCASAIYVANDLLDIQSDRAHPRKRLRPFAAGELSIPLGLAMTAVLFVSAIALAMSTISVGIAGVLVLYATASMTYSARIKREAVADVFLLAGLYVLRILAGGIATGIEISTWLLAFGMFFFLNLALVKRFTELNVSQKMVGRGYTVDDSRWMHVVGTSAGYMAVLVLALYASEPAVAALYRRPSLLVLLCPLLLYWVTRTWFHATRRAIDDDPVLAAIRDPASYVVAAAGALVLLFAR